MRKCKVGIDYFSHDVDIMQDKKIKLLKARHGLLGYAVYLRILEELYKDTGYYLKCDEDFNMLFADDNNLDYNVYILILNDCIKEELFNNNLYKEYSVLTSKRIQENYCSATERRKEVEFYKEYLLIDVNKLYGKEVNVNILALNADIGTQSKGNRKKSKEKDIYIASQMLSMTKDEYDKLISWFGKSRVDSKIEYSKNYKNLKNYNSLYLTLLCWLKKDCPEVITTDAKKQPVELKVIEMEFPK